MTAQHERPAPSRDEQGGTPKGEETLRAIIGILVAEILGWAASGPLQPWIRVLLVLLLVLGGAAAAVGFYARGSYFVGLDEGRVAIYKGRPGGLLWFSPTVEERTTLTEASVPPARKDDVANGHPVASLDEARTYVRNLEAIPGGTSAPPDEATTTTLAPAATTTPPARATSTP